MDKGIYGLDLIINLELQVDAYEQDRQKYWENQSETGNIDSAIDFDRAERFAKAVLMNAERLIPVQEIEGDLSSLQFEIRKFAEIDRQCAKISNLNLQREEKRKLLEEVRKEYQNPEAEDSPLRLVWERFMIGISWEAVGKIEEGALRIFQLYRLVLRFAPSISTQMFLSRLGRCYIWGFYPECIILCRAVIDTAFRDTITDEICEKHLGKTKNYQFKMLDRIQAALKEGIINEDIKKLTDIVRERGNKAVHYQPDITKDVWGTICDTVAVLERIAQKK